eukprot:jgi/Botrbrau1/3055/Bobra.0070s0050.1
MELVPDPIKDPLQTPAVLGGKPSLRKPYNIQSVGQDWQKELPEDNQATTSATLGTSTAIVLVKPDTADACSTVGFVANGPLAPATVEQHSIKPDDMGVCSSDLLVALEMQPKISEDPEAYRPQQGPAESETKGLQHFTPMPSSTDPIDNEQFSTVPMESTSGDMRDGSEGMRGGHKHAVQSCSTSLHPEASSRGRPLDLLPHSSNPVSDEGRDLESSFLPGQTQCEGFLPAQDTRLEVTGPFPTTSSPSDLGNGDDPHLQQFCRDIHVGSVARSAGGPGATVCTDGVVCDPGNSPLKWRLPPEVLGSGVEVDASNPKSIIGSQLSRDFQDSCSAAGVENQIASCLETAPSVGRAGGDTGAQRSTAELLLNLRQRIDALQMV